MITNSIKTFLGFVSVLCLMLLSGASSSSAEDLLIIVPYKPFTDIPIQSDELWLDYAHILQEYKENTGISTAILTLEDIRRNYERYRGIDEPERIKKAIYDYVKNRGVKYVMLVGDAGVFPVRYQFHGYSSNDLTYWAWDKEGNYWYQYEGYGFKPCDAYYANLWDDNDPSKAFDTWDADGDRLWGELYYDNFRGIDGNTIHPDVAVGRVPCKTPDEFMMYIIKIMKYEFWTSDLNSFEETGYKKFDLLLGGGWSDSQAVERSIARALPDDHIPALLLGAKDEAWSLDLDGDVTENVDPALEIINRVFLNHDELQFPFLLNYSGHGNPTGWAEPSFGYGNVGAMSNVDMPVLVIAPGSCSTGQFAKGGRHLHIPSSPDTNGTDTTSMAEAFLTDNSVGGVIYVGGVTSMQPPAIFWNQKFIEAIIDGAFTIGDAFLDAMEEFIRHYNLDTANTSNWIEVDNWPDSSVGGKWNWFPAARFDTIYKIVLFGDPSLRIHGVTLPHGGLPSTTLYTSNWVNLQDLNDATGGIHVHHVSVSTSDVFGIVTTEYRVRHHHGDEVTRFEGESPGGRDFDLRFPVSRSMEGDEYFLYCYSINYIGMPGREATETIGFDFTLPTSSIDISETDDPVTVDGETRSSVDSITITASDERSGVARIEYRYGNTGRINAAPSTHFTIDFDCVPFANDLVLNYRAVDVAGNAEAWHSVTLHRRSCSNADPATLFYDFNIFQPLIDFPPSFSGGVIDLAINSGTGAQKPDYIRFEYDGPINSDFKGGQWQKASEATFNSKKGIWTASWDTEQFDIENGFYMVRAVAGFNGAIAPTKALGGSSSRESASDPMILLIDNIDPNSYQFVISPAKSTVKPGDSLDIEVNFKGEFATLHHARLGLLVDGALLDNLEQDKLLKTASNVKQGEEWAHRFTIQMGEKIEGMDRLKIGAFIQSDEIGLLMADPVYITIVPPDVTISGNVTDTDGRLISATLVLEGDHDSFEAEATSEHGFHFYNVPAGDYELHLENLQDGYRLVWPTSTSFTVHARGKDITQNFKCAPEDKNAPIVTAMSDWKTAISSGRIWGLAYDTHFGTGIKDVKVGIKDEITGKWFGTGNVWQDTETWFSAEATMRYGSKGTECLSGTECSDYLNRIRDIHSILRPDNSGLVWTYRVTEPELLVHGRKVILIKAEDNAGNTATTELRNVILDADFEITASSTNPMTLAFEDRSSGPVIFRSWDFGDGHTSSAMSPVHTYSAGGTYEITLYVEGVDSSDSVTKTYTVSVSGITPDIKANDMDQLDISGEGQSITLSLALQSDGAVGQNADWWLVALLPEGVILHYDLAGRKWVTGFDLTDFTYQGPLFDFALIPVFNGYTISSPMANADFVLPEGTSYIFFGVDTLMNGTLDMEYLKYDFVEINVGNP